MYIFIFKKEQCIYMFIYIEVFEHIHMFIFLVGQVLQRPKVTTYIAIVLRLCREARRIDS